MTQNEVNLILQTCKQNQESIKQIALSLREIRTITQSQETRLSKLEGRVIGIGVGLSAAAACVGALYYIGVL